MCASAWKHNILPTRLDYLSSVALLYFLLARVYASSRSLVRRNPDSAPRSSLFFLLSALVPATGPHIKWPALPGHTGGCTRSAGIILHNAVFLPRDLEAQITPRDVRELLTMPNRKFNIVPRAWVLIRLRDSWLSSVWIWGMKPILVVYVLVG